MKLDIAGAGTEGRHTLDAVGANGTGSGLRFEAGAYVLDLHVAGACGSGDVGGSGQGDVVVDADVAE